MTHVKVIANPVECSRSLLVVVFVLIPGLLANYPVFAACTELGRLIAERPKKNIKLSRSVESSEGGNLAAFKNGTQPAKIAQFVKANKRFFDAAMPIDNRAPALSCFRSRLRPMGASVLCIEAQGTQKLFALQDLSLEESADIDPLGQLEHR